MMKTALIGFTGFVGSNLLQQKKFDDFYNSKNITEIHGKKYDLIVSAATPSLFWKANQDPKTDLKVIKDLINSLKQVQTKKFVLISTIFVYDNPFDVNEETLIDEKKLTPYGLNRLKLEKFIKKQFQSYLIVRLPNLFGQGLKKNFVFDLIYNNRLDLTHKDSLMQWYNLVNIWKDIQIALQHDLKLVNFAVEPVFAADIARQALGIEFKTITEKPALNHAMKTKYSDIYGAVNDYLYDRKYTLKELKKFIVRAQYSLPSARVYSHSVEGGLGKARTRRSHATSARGRFINQEKAK